MSWTDGVSCCCCCCCLQYTSKLPPARRARRGTAILEQQQQVPPAHTGKTMAGKPGGWCWALNRTWGMSQGLACKVTILFPTFCATSWTFQSPRRQPALTSSLLLLLLLRVMLLLLLLLWVLPRSCSCQGAAGAWPGRRCQEIGGANQAGVQQSAAATEEDIWQRHLQHAHTAIIWHQRAPGEQWLRHQQCGQWPAAGGAGRCSGGPKTAAAAAAAGGPGRPEAQRC